MSTEIDLDDINDADICREFYRRGLEGRTKPAPRVDTTIDVDVEVDLDDIEDDDIADEFRRRKLTGAEDLPAGELDLAASYLMRGDRAESLIHLERALGGDFVGRLAVPEAS